MDVAGERAHGRRHQLPTLHAPPTPHLAHATLARLHFPPLFPALPCASPPQLPAPTLRPATPQKWAGMRMLPPTSPPMPKTAPFSATSAASPPDDPPDVLKRPLSLSLSLSAYLSTGAVHLALLWGLSVRPYTGLAQVKLRSDWGTLVRQMGTAPSCFSVFSTTSRSCSARGKWEGEAHRDDNGILFGGMPQIRGVAPRALVPRHLRFKLMAYGYLGFVWAHSVPTIYLITTSFDDLLSPGEWSSGL